MYVYWKMRSDSINMKTFHFHFLPFTLRFCDLKLVQSLQSCSGLLVTTVGFQHLKFKVPRGLSFVFYVYI